LGGICRIKVAREITCKKVRLYQPTDAVGNLLLEKPTPVPFKVVEGTSLEKDNFPFCYLYEIETIAGKDYHFDLKKMTK
jgi:hypothetical protein